MDFSAEEDFVPYDPYAAFVSDLPSSEILQNYLEECERSNAVLAGKTMSTQPLGRHGNTEV